MNALVVHKHLHFLKYYVYIGYKFLTKRKLILFLTQKKYYEGFMTFKLPRK